ncbi:hypothetical protein DRO61_07725, partial [Candidatus Bathyarchaeota archaeon]
MANMETNLIKRQRTCQPKWNGRKHFTRTHTHVNSDLLTDDLAISLLEKGILTEDMFIILPKGYKKPSKDITPTKQLIIPVQTIKAGDFVKLNVPVGIKQATLHYNGTEMDKLEVLFEDDSTETIVEDIQTYIKSNLEGYEVTAVGYEEPEVNKSQLQYEILPKQQQKLVDGAIEWLNDETKSVRE